MATQSDRSKRKTGTKRSIRKVRSTPHSPQLSTLTARQKATYQRCLALLSYLRNGKGSFTQLLRKHHLDSRTAQKYLGKELLRGTGGKRVRVSMIDRLMREMLFPTSAGDVPVRIRGSKAASKLSEFFHDRDKLLRGRLSAESFEAKWQSVRVAGQEIYADAGALLDRANAGDLKVENLYASTGAAE